MLPLLVMVKLIPLFTLPEKTGISQGAAADARGADRSLQIRRCWKPSSKTTSGMLEKESSTLTGNQTQQALQGHGRWRTRSEPQNDFLVMQKACSDLFQKEIKGCGGNCNLSPNRRERAAFKATMPREGALICGSVVLCFQRSQVPPDLSSDTADLFPGLTC